MVIKGIIKRGEYFDSVSLMMVSKDINEQDGILDSAVVMGTKENRDILKASGLLIKKFEQASDTDLLIAIKAKAEKVANNIIDRIDEFLNNLRTEETSDKAFTPKSIEGAVQILPEANLALISVPGKYASSEAQKALDNGLFVMIFSDNVPLKDEIELKQFAKEKGLLVMGPDCGTAIINGVPLAFANVVNRGDIGIVAASGTGLQEVSCIISNQGAGISQAIGTGGRDIKQEVGGLMFIESIKLLLKDEDTKVILLISKPPSEKVVEKIANVLEGGKKPVVAVFLGADVETIKNYGMIAAKTLEQGALLALALSQGKNTEDVNKKINSRDSNLKNIAKNEAIKLNKNQKYIRALFSGGTFCGETQVLFAQDLENIYLNVPVGKSHRLKDSLKSEKHTVVDLGADEFTVGKPHPMIDYSTRNKRIIDEANNPETAVLLLDIVLGFGSNKNPLAEITPVIKEAKANAQKKGRYLPIVCSVVGTNNDPQNRSLVVKGLEEAGALVLESNAAASKLAGYIVSAGNTKSAH
ncbi:acyl-CoA synthetase FdrA [candidate division KSB1 bacterium]|nr:acyl-CoA synthetase FdrA [candidate division KSB1 bacterium]